MRRSLGSPVTAGFGAVIAALFASAAISYHNTNRLWANQRAVARSHELLTEAEAVLSTLKDAETDQRGYLLTGAEDYLRPYEEAAQGVRLGLARLARLAADDPGQSDRVAALSRLVAVKFEELGETIALLKAGGPEKGFAAARAVVQTDRGKQHMEAVRTAVADIEATEVSRLVEREKESGRSYWIAVVAEGLLTVLSVSLVGLAFELVRREFAARHRAEEALREADRRKDEFLAMLSHELRNPLAPIRNAVQVLRRQDPADPDLAWARDLIDRQLEQLTRLVDDLLDVSRITGGKIRLVREALDLAAVVERAVETSRPLLDERRQRLEVRLPPESLWVEGDATRLAQVLANLLNNAAKYTDVGGQVWLTAEKVGAEAVLRVRDTGIGIPAAMLPHVFDLFTQVDTALDRTQGGLGIGLTLVRRLVEMHGGRVEAHSAGRGRGSEFVVRLPLRTGRAPAAAPTAATAPSLPAGRTGRRILIVDDSRDGAESLARLLRLVGHETRTAADGPQALATAADYRPEVVVCDIGLPGMNGYEVGRQLRALPGLGDVLLVALTGFGSEGDRLRSDEAGFAHHLVKPVDLAALQAVLGSGG
jgi:signal transduction histidine kinase